ncbi:MAG: methyltransferase domain-containing protein [Candidatus Omnitrophica bacterium]|nr:methyltransferase domain-containing protein [Candidatus Omnitrophota bacterium]MDD5437183.1 methyltransferase domain-containing protein [Candidatus Omnitrophota bacterium]
MTTRPNKAVVADNFSKYAGSYDIYTTVQGEAAGMLAKILPDDGVTKILEVGCGTGSYTRILKDKFSRADIKAIDISAAMVKLARHKLDGRNVIFEVGDVEEIISGDKYDLATSNAAFHWFNDLERVIGKMEELLTENGVLLFSAFGPKTFSELKASLVSVSGEDVSIAPDTFPGRPEIEGLLRKYFKRARITERLIRESYASLHELLAKIKYSGTRGAGSDMKKAWSPGLLKKIERAYVERFGSIEATYQVFFCEAVK